jgi:hypothetical protein
MPATQTAALYYTERRPGVALPTIPGMVHGIVTRDPYEVQCDECLVVRSGDAKQQGLQIILADIRFNPRLYQSDKRRLCRECRDIHWKAYRS